jgi:hypothetical protein
MYSTISNSSAAQSTGWGRTWRRELLAGSAFGGVSFSGGMLALVLSAATPEPALAQCFTSQTTFGVSPEIIACGNTFSTTNSVHHGGDGDSGLSRSDRAYWYDVPIQAEIFRGPITGYGLEFRTPDARGGTSTGITVQLDSGSSITQSSVPNFLGEANTATLAIMGSGTPVTLTGVGTILTTGAAAGDVAVSVTNTGAGNVQVGAPGNPASLVLSSGAPGPAGGTLQTVANSGTTSIFLNGGSLTTTNALGNGIISTSNSGDINITLTGNTAILNTSGAPTPSLASRPARAAISILSRTRTWEAGWERRFSEE